MSEIYSPSEDSYLLKEVLEENFSFIIDKNKEITVLEIGVGSGIILETLRDLNVSPKNILGVDINKDAVSLCKSKGFNCIYSNLFDNINQSFDLIIFNPPYLPEDKREPESSRLITSGGKKGSEIINDFLHQALNYLNKNGRIFLLISSLTKELDLDKYHYKVLKTKNLFMEQLKVLELTKI